jgi:hypothetical protein
MYDGGGKKLMGNGGLVPLKFFESEIFYKHLSS